MKKKLYGTTLVEVITAMTIVIIVSIILYIGISASAKFIVHGTDLRNASAEAEKKMENAISENEGVTRTITYKINGVKYSTEVCKITTEDKNKVMKYICFIPYISENNE